MAQDFDRGDLDADVGDPGASLGVVLAGVVLAAAFLPWPEAVTTTSGVAVVTAVLGAVALAAFLGRRTDMLDRRLGAAVAGLASTGAVGFAVYAFVLGIEPGASVGAGIGVAALGGVGGLVAAAVDWRAVPADRFAAAAETTVLATIVGLGGLVAIVVWQVLLVNVYAIAVGVPEELPAVAASTISAVSLGLGTGSVALLYLRWTDRDWSYVDVRRPSWRTLGYAVGGVVALFAALMLVSVVMAGLGIESSNHGVVEQAQRDPGILLVLIPASWLLIGPGEELLFRNVVQKSLYDVFPRAAAIVVASVIFAAAHVFAYLGSTIESTVASLAVVFVLSLVLGTLYERTDDLVVPAFVHGTFNAIQFALLYSEVSGSNGGEITGALVGTVPVL